VIKRRFEAGEFTSHTTAPVTSKASPFLPVAGAIHFPVIATMHLVRIFDFCRTEWPGDHSVSNIHPQRADDDRVSGSKTRRSLTKLDAPTLRDFTAV
jgi:hypothetical protein